MNVMKLVTGVVTPVLASKVAGMFGVPEGVARKVLSVGVPVVLAALMKRGASPDGADALGSALSRLGDNPLESLGHDVAGEPAQAQAAAQGGSDLLSSLIGGGMAGTLASKLAGYAGADEKATASMLGLSSSLAMGGMKKTADEQGLDAAGILKLLDSQKDDIAGAIPADFARQLEGTGILSPQMLSAAAPAAPAAAAAAPRSPTPPPAKSGGGGMWRWIIGLAVLAVLAWLLLQLFGGAPEEEVVPAEVETGEAQEAPETATETTTETAVADPLVVGGEDLGASLQGILDGLSGTLAGVTDAGSAEAAVASLTEADNALASLQSSAAGLSDEGRTALQQMVAGALPAVRSAADGLLADSSIGAILQPLLEGILEKLEALAG